MRDFFIRQDLQKTGIPERTIRVLEKASLLIEALERITASENAISDVNDATDALNEAIEDANLSLTSLDGRVDVLESAGPYVEVAGDTMSGPLNVNALLECDSLRINTVPVVAAAVASTHTVAVNLNGTTYYLLASNV